MSGALPMEFDPASLILLNVIMACMMFGVSLSLRLEDFKRIALAPIAPLAGLFAQFLLLPLATCLVISRSRVRLLVPAPVKSKAYLKGWAFFLPDFRFRVGFG